MEILIPFLIGLLIAIVVVPFVALAPPPLHSEVHGALAQRESTCLAGKGSGVRIPDAPPEKRDQNWNGRSEMGGLLFARSGPDHNCNDILRQSTYESSTKGGPSPRSAASV